MSKIKIQDLPSVSLGEIENSGGCTRRAHLFSTIILPDRVQLMVYECIYNGDNFVSSTKNPDTITIKDNDGKALRIARDESGGVIIADGKPVQERYQKEDPTTDFTDYIALDSIVDRSAVKLELIKKHYKL